MNGILVLCGKAKYFSEVKWQTGPRSSCRSISCEHFKGRPCWFPSVPGMWSLCLVPGVMKERTCLVASDEHFLGSYAALGTLERWDSTVCVEESCGYLHSKIDILLSTGCFGQEVALQGFGLCSVDSCQNLAGWEEDVSSSAMMLSAREASPQ